MGYNALSGTISTTAVKFDLDEITALTVSGSLLYGDGSEISNLPRIVANASTDNLITVGANSNSMVGEPNLKFNGSVLTIIGDITASSGISASAFIGDGSGLTNVLADHVVAEGPTYSIQYHDSDGDLTGSSAFLFDNNILKVDGTLKMSRRNITSTATASVSDYFIGVSTVGSVVSVRLQSAISLQSGQMLVVKDEGGAANANNITILASGSETIDGQNTVVLESPYASVQLYCNGSDKYFIY